MRPGELREQDHTEVWLWSDLHLGHESGNERPARNRRFVEVVQKGRTIEFTHDIARKRKLTLLIEAVHLTAEPETAYPRMTDAVGTLAVHDLTPDDSYYWIIEERDNPTNPRQSSRPWTSRPSSTTSNVEEVLIAAPPARAIWWSSTARKARRASAARKTSTAGRSPCGECSPAAGPATAWRGDAEADRSVRTSSSRTSSGAPPSSTPHRPAGAGAVVRLGRRPRRCRSGRPGSRLARAEPPSFASSPRGARGAEPRGPTWFRGRTVRLPRARSAASTPGSTAAGSRTPPSPRTWPSSPRSAAAPMKRSPVITASRRSRSRATAAASARLVAGGPTTERRTPSMVRWLRGRGAGTSVREFGDPRRGDDQHAAGTRTLEDALPESERVVAAVSRHFVEGRARARRAAGPGGWAGVSGSPPRGARRGRRRGLHPRAAVRLSEAAPPCASSGSAPHPGHCRSGAISGVRGGCHPRGDGRLSAGSARWCGV